MKVGIVGAGMAGMAAAWDLSGAGHEVAVYDGNDAPGGIAGGFREPGWAWSVERFYHHWFETDRHMFDLIEELGLSDRVVFPRPKTVVFHDGQFYPLDSPLAALRFPGFSVVDVVRFGAVTAWLRFGASWRRLERSTAREWMARWYGGRLFTTLFEPLLEGKFGPYHHEVNMAWMWARLKTRSTRLGSFTGGFQAFFDAFAEQLEARGVGLRLGCAVDRVEPLDGGFTIRSGGGAETFDKVLLTTSPNAAARLAPELDSHLGEKLQNLKSMGAVVLVMALDRPLSKEGFYWYNIPKQAGFPFLALVEHTNFVSSENFGGEHIVYCGDYLPPDHGHFDLGKEELMDLFLPSFSRINTGFDASWVRSSWLFSTRYAQPVPVVGHSANIPPVRTPVDGLYLASMSQVYPWDRGTNFAVEIGRRAARIITES